MVEQIVGLQVEETYAALKAVLLERGCKIVSEQAPSSVSVVQGSVWGVSPRTAKKLVNFTLSNRDSETKITANSSLTSDWKNLAIAGTVLSAIVALLCLWIGLDLQAFATRSEMSFWSWIVAGSTLALVLANILTKVFFGLAVFLVLVIVLELFVVFYAIRKVNAFAEQTLKALEVKK